ncbi:hypothetical protein LINGRAPRIM_LOCUS20 [Linum grandiflorum]
MEAASDAAKEIALELGFPCIRGSYKKNASEVNRRLYMICSHGYRSLAYSSSRSGDSIRTTKTGKLGCRFKVCEVRRLMEAGKLLTKLNLHRFWATLDYTNPPDGAEWENVAVGELAQWESAVDEVASLGESSIRSCARLLQYYLHPEAEDIREPKENAVLKGRPRRRSNARDPSWFEKVTPRKS